MHGTKRVTHILATVVLALTAATALAHGGEYQPPAPQPRGAVPPGLPPTGGGPVTGGGDGPGPITGGGSGGGPLTGGGGGGGPLTGGGTGLGPGKGPTTGGGTPTPTTGIPGGRGAVDRTTPTGVDAGHWTRWWYANRAQLIVWKARAGERARDVTPGVGAGDDALLFAEVRAALADALSNRDEDIASGAAIALGKDGDPSMAPALLRLLRDDKRQQPVREAAALALGLLRVESGPSADEARRGLEGVASDVRERDRLRAMALYALGLRGEMASAPLLLDVAAQPASTWDVPAAAVSALGMGRHELTVPELVTYLEGSARGGRSDRVRRVYAAHALARSGARDALPALREATRDSQEEVRRAAVLALGAVADAADDESADALIRVVLRDKDDGVQHAAVLSLGRIGHDRAEAVLDHAFLKGDGRMQPFAALGLGLYARHAGHEDAIRPVTKEFLRRSNSDVLAPLAIACGLAGDMDAAPTLRRIVESGGDTALRAHAALALGLIGDQAAVDGLREVLEANSDPELRRETALALGMLGDVQATRILRDLVADGGSIYVAGSAAVALGRIGGAASGRVLLDLFRDEHRPDMARAMAGVGLGLLLDESEGARLSAIGADLDWYLQTSAVHEILTIL